MQNKVILIFSSDDFFLASSRIFFKERFKVCILNAEDFTGVSEFSDYAAIFIDKKQVKTVVQNVFISHFLAGSECPVVVVDKCNFISALKNFSLGHGLDSADLCFAANGNFISYGMREFYLKLSKSFKSDITVLLTGESGSGKDFTAELIHKNSFRKEKKFINQNVAELNPNLIESAFFGTVKNAFTGAADTPGIFLTAGEGTLLLDEFAELSIDLQAKLLGVLDKKKFIPVGGTVEKSLKARLMFATDADLNLCVAQGKFRRQLLYRINAFEIKIPPLREHIQDVPSLVRQFARPYGKIFSKDALSKLIEYNWPGNIRELKNCVERACVMAPSCRVENKDIEF